MITSRTPFKIPRIISLLLLTMTGIVAGSLGVNGLAKLADVRNSAKKEAPPGVDVEIDTGNFVPIGIVVSSACGVLSAVAGLLLITKPLASRWLRLQGLIFTFFSMYLLSIVIPFTYFFLTRSATFVVTANGITIPPDVVKSIVGSQTSELDYNNHPPLRAAVIMAWVVLPFGVGSSILSFIAARSVRNSENTSSVQSSSRRDSTSSTDKVAATTEIVASSTEKV